MDSDETQIKPFEQQSNEGRKEAENLVPWLLRC
jgi:hypothetical protein